MRSQDAPRDLSGADGRPDPWERLEARIAPACPKGGGRGRQPHPLSVMLRVHCVRPFCNLSDPAMEDLLARRRASGALPGRCLRRFRTRRRSRLPPPAGAPRTGAPAVREIRDRLAERGGGGVLKKGASLTPPSSRRHRRPGTRATPAIRRCTGPGRGTGGISG